MVIHRIKINNVETAMLRVCANGNAILTGSLTQNSDARLKDNVEDAELSDCMNMSEI